MTDTVFILGAGFSYDAGVPLLSGFVDRMIEFAVRGKNGDKQLNQSDVKIFQEVNRIRKELDGYQGRSAFDDRNIEDILSLISFKLIGKPSTDSNEFGKMKAAIARTIELTCSTTHPGTNEANAYQLNESGNQVYRDFWKHLLKAATQDSKFPTIITFNYDLLLERALHQVLIGTYFNPLNNPISFDKFRLNYHFSNVPSIVYQIQVAIFQQNTNSPMNGVRLRPLTDNPELSKINIDILKLHGSLNFPTKPERDWLKFAHKITHPVEYPFILPPVFNKMNGGIATKMWQVAMKKLSEAKNIVIVGYSLPKTDIYMQYFLKAALGPNLNLNNIFVFDPLLHEGSPASDAMMERYKSCFTANLVNRIIFHPDCKNIRTTQYGTTKHFVELLENNKGGLIF